MSEKGSMLDMLRDSVGEEGGEEGTEDWTYSKPQVDDSLDKEKEKEEVEEPLPRPRYPPTTKVKGFFKATGRWRQGTRADIGASLKRRIRRAAEALAGNLGLPGETRELEEAIARGMARKMARIFQDHRTGELGRQRGFTTLDLPCEPVSPQPEDSSSWFPLWNDEPSFPEFFYQGEGGQCGEGGGGSGDEFYQTEPGNSEATSLGSITKDGPAEAGGKEAPSEEDKSKEDQSWDKSQWENVGENEERDDGEASQFHEFYYSDLDEHLSGGERKREKRKIGRVTLVCFGEESVWRQSEDEEMRSGGKCLAERGVKFDLVLSSELPLAKSAVDDILVLVGQDSLPRYTCSELNPALTNSDCRREMFGYLAEKFKESRALEEHFARVAKIHRFIRYLILNTGCKSVLVVGSKDSLKGLLAEWLGLQVWDYEAWAPSPACPLLLSFTALGARFSLVNVELLAPDSQAQAIALYKAMLERWFDRGLFTRYNTAEIKKRMEDDCPTIHSLFNEELKEALNRFKEGEGWSVAKLPDMEEQPEIAEDKKETHDGRQLTTRERLYAWDAWRKEFCPEPGPSVNISPQESLQNALNVGLLAGMPLHLLTLPS